MCTDICTCSVFGSKDLIYTWCNMGRNTANSHRNVGGILQWLESSYMGIKSVTVHPVMCALYCICLLKSKFICRWIVAQSDSGILYVVILLLLVAVKLFRWYLSGNCIAVCNLFVFTKLHLCWSKLSCANNSRHITEILFSLKAWYKNVIIIFVWIQASAESIVR